MIRAFFIKEQKNMANATGTKAKPKIIVEGVRHVVRKIGEFTVPDASIMSAADFEKYLLDVYFNDGWDVLDFEYIGSEQGSQYGVNFDPMKVLYVLVKRAG
jgi:hypothetical protein